MRKIAVSGFKMADYERMVWVIAPEPGTTIEDIMKPDYWAHVAKNLQPFHHIEVHSADRTFYAELLVRAVEPFAAKVHMLRHEIFETPAVKKKVAAMIPEGYDIAHRGRNGWSVVRLTDNVVLQDKESTKEAAAMWLDRHLLTLA